MHDDLPLANSPAEVRMFLMVLFCRACGRGPCRAEGEMHIRELDGRNVCRVDTICASCHAIERFSFRLRCTERDEGGNTRINPSPNPSELIDVAQWLTLFRLLTESADHEADKAQARRHRLQAAQCLEEALKMFDDDDNDLPPPEALFHEESRRRFREDPRRYTRQRLMALRSKLPKTTARP